MNSFQHWISSVAVAGATLFQLQAATLTEVFKDNNFQLTGVTISKSGRLFVNYPKWSDQYLNAVVEVGKDGTAKPFPDEKWNRWDGKSNTAGDHFVCVQSVVVDEDGMLWILDPAAPLLGPVVPGGPKMVQVDLRTNTVVRVINFGADVVKTNSYLNDVRFDLKNHTAYITDSGVGALVVVDLGSGKAKRFLDGHPSTQAEKGQQIVINGKPVVGPDGKPPTFNADGIALSPDGQYLYYQALTGSTMYRVKTDALRLGQNPNVETVGKTFPVDGLWIDKKNSLYLSGLQQNAVMRMLPNKKIETVVKDDRLQWPDTFTQGADGAIYITVSRIHEGARYNNGKSVRTQPYAVYKFTP